ALRVQHQQDFVRRHNPDDLLPSHGLNRPRLPAPLGTERRDDGAGSDGHCSIRCVRRPYAWLVALAGGAAVYGAARRRRATRVPEPAPVADERADELRTKLAQAREAGDDRAAFESGETTIDAAPDPEARRSEV